MFLILFSNLCFCEVLNNENHKYDNLTEIENYESNLTEINQQLQDFNDFIKNREESIKQLRQQINQKKLDIIKANKANTILPEKYDPEILKNKLISSLPRTEYTNFSLIKIVSPSQTLSSTFFDGIKKKIHPTKPFKGIELGSNRKWNVKGTTASALFRSDEKTKFSLINFPNITREICNPQNIAVKLISESHTPKVYNYTLPFLANSGYNISIQAQWIREFEIVVNKNYGNKTHTCIPEIKLFGDIYMPSS